MKMNHHYGELKASYLFVDIAHKVAAYQEAHPEKEIIRLGIGDVTQPLAKCVVTAMQDAAAEMGTKEGFHGYGPEQGYPFLKQAIQGYYAGRGTQLAEDEIFISDGAKSDLANVLGLFDVDNTVLVPDPVYPTYVDDNVTDGRKIIYGRTSQENGFLGMPDDSVKADIIYICSPNNPTGAAYTREQLKAWVDYAKKNNAVILYDAAYECFITDPALARSIFEVEGARECAIEICSFSKIAGFTGTRCGYTIVPHELEREGMNLNKLWLRRQTTKFNGVPYVVQRAAAAVFTESGMAEIQANLDYYRQNAKVIADALDECGVWYCGGKNEELGVLRLAAGELRRGRHPGCRLRRVRRGLLPPDRLRRCRKDQGRCPAHQGRHPDSVILHKQKGDAVLNSCIAFFFYFRPVSRLSSITARTMMPMTRIMPTIPISIIGSVVIHEVR